MDENKKVEAADTLPLEGLTRRQKEILRALAEEFRQINQKNMEEWNSRFFHRKTAVSLQIFAGMLRINFPILQRLLLQT